jgi:hypothetical protein
MDRPKQKEMSSFLLNQLFLIGFNFINSQLDAYRILRNKQIAHGINFCLYGAFVGVLCWLGEYNIKSIILFCASAFFNRQFSFDIPLNLRRGLNWYYQSVAKPPKAILDKMELFLFGDHPMVGVKIAIIYWILYGNIIAFYFYSK